MRSALAGSPREIVGADIEVPVVTGGTRRYVNLDVAASAPALRTVADGVAEVLPWYASVHRGAGFKSRVSTELYERAREAIRAFVGGRPDDAVVITRNTTDAINLLASALPERTTVLVFAVEHHANMLPWRHGTHHGRVRYLPVPASPDDLVAQLDAALREERAGGMAPDGTERAGRGPILVSTTGASNVTGEIWPLGRISETAHAHGARFMVDAAQLAPHLPVDMARDGIDYLAMSGHKLYAPYGAGALVGRHDWLEETEPFLWGGGAVRFVTLDDVMWAPLPDRQEAGSPNVLGAVAMGIACETLAGIGMESIAAEELAMHAHAVGRLSAIPGVRVHLTWGLDQPHIGLVTFAVDGYDHGEVASILSAEHAIGVRHGCFCAHPLMLHLLHMDDGSAAAIREALRAGESPALPGAVRMSFGLATTEADIDAVADALASIAADGPGWTYAVSPATGEWEPDPDPRPWPALPLAAAPVGPAGAHLLRATAGEAS
ncbi:MAG: aminotransferase class V-fold PLP-dependent enzyme [Chloroflexi bacterium]|jgi:selenocysteine lyase/cysteine desulfurase|nr:aminotransferase class V-fold PLP-dependent enzyme [Chloroflexota bacterium]